MGAVPRGYRLSGSEGELEFLDHSLQESSLGIICSFDRGLTGRKVVKLDRVSAPRYRGHLAPYPPPRVLLGYCPLSVTAYIRGPIKGYI